MDIKRLRMSNYIISKYARFIKTCQILTLISEQYFDHFPSTYWDRCCCRTNYTSTQLLWQITRARYIGFQAQTYSLLHLFVEIWSVQICVLHSTCWTVRLQSYFMNIKPTLIIWVVRWICSFFSSLMLSWIRSYFHWTCGQEEAEWSLAFIVHEI